MQIMLCYVVETYEGSEGRWDQIRAVVAITRHPNCLKFIWKYKVSSEDRPSFLYENNEKNERQKFCIEKRRV